MSDEDIPSGKNLVAVNVKFSKLMLVGQLKKIIQKRLLIDNDGHCCGTWKLLDSIYKNKSMNIEHFKVAHY